MEAVRVAAALIWREGRFLIAKRPYTKARGGLWEFVGGKAEAGESLKEALKRECREEIAVEITVGELFMELTHEYPDLKVRLSLYEALIAQGEPQRLEHEEFRWITPDEIPQFDFCPADVEILAQLRKRYASLAPERLSSNGKA